MIFLKGSYWVSIRKELREAQNFDKVAYAIETTRLDRNRNNGWAVVATTLITALQEDLLSSRPTGSTEQIPGLHREIRPPPKKKEGKEERNNS